MDKIICVGKNYVEHARELGDAVPEKPVLFLKPPSVLRQAETAGSILAARLPEGRGAVHHECEIVVRLGAGGSDLDVTTAGRAIDAVTLGLDMTLRDVQQRLKKEGHPWEIGKVFVDSALLGPWLPVDPARMDQEFTFTVDNIVRQRGVAGQMSLSPAECVAHASAHFPLCAGDIVFTGTPAGVGPLTPGQLGEVRWGDTLLFRVQW